MPPRCTLVVLAAAALLAAAAPARAGDFNGDRLADFVVDASEGSTRVVLGRRDATPAGFTIRGPAAYFKAGLIGDIDGDGLDDILVTGFRRGVVVFGRRSVADIELGQRGTRPVPGGIEPQRIGDVNGDGIDDLARSRNRDILVLLGRRDRALATRRAYRIALRWSRFPEHRVVPAGDANGDGLDDLAVVAHDYWDCGEVVSCAGPAFVVFGRRAVRSIVVDDESRPYVRAGSAAAGYVLWAMVEDHRVASAGDFDGDGRDDLLFPEDRQSVGSYVAFGGGTARSFLANRWGWEEYAAPIGDVNGDGRGDVLVSLRQARTVVLGRRGRAPIDRGRLGRHGWRLTGAWDLTARVLGDVNGDRRDDFLVESGDPPVRRVVLGSRSTRDLDVRALGARGFALP
jgi:hypothetical protein